jgi:hypothetical protein
MAFGAILGICVAHGNSETKRKSKVRAGNRKSGSFAQKKMDGKTEAGQRKLEEKFGRGRNRT